MTFAANQSSPSGRARVVQRAACWAVLCSGSLFGCGASRVPLPVPVMPLVSTPDAPFRQQPPVLPPLVVEDHQPPPPVQSATLANGLTVWVVQRDAFPYVALSFCARGAGTFETQATPELMRLTTRAMVEGGLVWADGKEVEPPTINGEPVSFQVSPTHSKLQLRVLRPALEAGLDVLARTVRYPTFRGGKIDPVRLSEANQLAHGIGMSDLMLKTAVKAGFGTDIAQRVVPMRVNEVVEPPFEAVQQLYHDAFRPQSSALIAVGNTSLDELLPSIERAFGSWTAKPRAEAAAVPVPEAKSDGRSVHFFPSGRKQAQVLILQSAPPASETKDELPFALLSQAAIGSFRSHANTSLRHDAGLTYGVHSSIVRGRRTGFMTVEASFDADVVPTALGSLLDTFSSLQTTRMSDADMLRGKTELLADFEMAWGNNQALAAYLGSLFAEGKSPDWLAALPDALAAVSAEDVQRVAKRYLQPDNVEVGVTGDVGMAPDLAFFGYLEVYSLEAK